jgi:hypothetical protein
MDSTEPTEKSSTLSLPEARQLWVDCEERKIAPRLALKEIGKTQRPATKVIRSHMEETQLMNFDCGNGWAVTRDEVEKVTFSEDICTPYMDPQELERLKKEQIKVRSAFKTLPPSAKRARSDE